MEILTPTKIITYKLTINESPLPPRTNRQYLLIQRLFINEEQPQGLRIYSNGPGSFIVIFSAIHKVNLIVELFWVDKNNRILKKQKADFFAMSAITPFKNEWASISQWGHCIRRL